MCGIVYAHSFLGYSVNEKVIRAYKNQRSRGFKGFGYFLPQSNTLTHNTREGRILSLLGKHRANEVMFHHRFPTSTENTRRGCHPYSTKDFFGEHSYVLVHNGVLRNETALKKEHEALGIKYVSEHEHKVSEAYSTTKFNDSEALLWEVALFLEGKKETMDASGTIAFIVAQLDKDGKPLKLYFAHNSGNPLTIDFTKTHLYLSSTGEKTDVAQDVLHCFDYGTREITTTPLDIKKYHSPAVHHDWRSTNTQHSGHTPFTRGSTAEKASEVISREMKDARKDFETGTWVGQKSIPAVDSKILEKYFEMHEVKTEEEEDLGPLEEEVTRRVNWFISRYATPLDAMAAIEDALQDAVGKYTLYINKIEESGGLWIEEYKSYLEAGFEGIVLEAVQDIMSTMLPDHEDDYELETPRHESPKGNGSKGLTGKHFTVPQQG